ncbi:MAG: VIT1/CCC1 transporter family protein [Candidatus Micrarchaeota archaeon]|nr:VIT1/CCC1 transporter family protein [Candidatus Micrarchaeota archaeon]
MASKSEKRLLLEREFFEDEYIDRRVYVELAKTERKRELRALMERLSRMESGHLNLWEKMIVDEGALPTRPRLVWLRVAGFKIVRRLFGTAFMTKLLERNEAEGVMAYSNAISSSLLSASEKARVREILKEEMGHERDLLRQVERYEGGLQYTKSIVFGLSDGLVEVLAAVAGLAALVSSSVVVVVAGIIVGIAGTLSMAGGAYLASKSQNIVSTAIEEKGTKNARTDPAKDAYYTGIFYFLGALIPLIPFIFGATGYLGIALAIFFDIIALAIASVVIAVVSDTSIKRRTVEMVAITIGAAIVTVLIGTVARTYFGVSI